MRHRRSRLFLAGVALLAIGACVADPVALGSQDAGSKVPRASATPPVTAPPSPSAPPSPFPSIQTVPPETPLQAMLPNFVGSDFLEKRALTVADVTVPGSGYLQVRIFGRVFAAIDRPPEAFEGASAIGSPMSIVAMRVAGTSATDLADAFVDATLAEVPGGTITSVQIGGRDARRLRWPDDALGSDTHILIVGDVVLVFTAHADKEPLVAETLTAMFEPKLEAVLPAELGGRATTRFSFPGAAVGEAGDMCSIVCPGEPHRLARQLGVDVDGVDVAVAYIDVAPGVVIVAMRVEGADAAGLVEARIASSGRSPNPFAARQPMTIGGKDATWIRIGAFDSITDTELLYAHADVLYIVRPAPLEGAEPNALVVEAFAALP